MKKLFEIPVYALSASKLGVQVNSRILKLKKTLANSDTDAVEQVIDFETFPMRSWDYNHIIGYIRISATKTDVLFDVFMPLPFPKRYVWNSKRRLFCQNICVNGAHVYLGTLKSNEKIREAVSNMLDQVICDHIPHQFYVDREAFDTLNPYFDYLRVIEGL